MYHIMDILFSLSQYQVCGKAVDNRYIKCLIHSLYFCLYLRYLQMFYRIYIIFSQYQVCVKAVDKCYIKCIFIDITFGFI
jgi:hypothetical protein